MPRPWELLESTTVLASPWLTVQRERLRTGRGRIVEPFWRTRSKSWACTVALTPDDRIVLVEQYRRGCDAVTRELPAGDCDGDDPAAAALRELAEETGYRALGPPEPLGALWPEPARDDACAHGFLVRVAAEPAAPTPDAEEDIAAVTLPWAAVRADPVAQGLRHAAHAAFVLLAARRA